MSTALRILPLVLLLAGSAPALDNESAAKRLLSAAKQRESAGDFDGARRDLELFVGKFPDSPYVAGATFRLADLCFRRGDWESADRVSRELIESHGQSRFAAGAHSLLAEILARRAKTRAEMDAARTAFRDTWLLFGAEAYPRIPWREAARVRDGELGLEFGSTDEAASRFVAALEGAPPPAWAQRALFGFSSALLAEGAWLDAVDTLQQLLDGSENRTAGASMTQALARMRLTLIHRQMLRPEVGEKRWRKAQKITLSGLSLERPVGVAARRDGRLLITDQKLGIVDLPADGGNAAVLVSQQNLGRPAWDLGGAALVAAGGKTLLPTKRRAQSFGDPDKKPGVSLENISAAERGSLGEWFLLTSKPGRALVFREDGGFQRALPLPDRADPIDLARDPWARIYVLDRREGDVLRYTNAESKGQRVARARAKRPRAMAADLLGNVYVLGESGAIEVFDSTGAPIAVLGPLLPGGIELLDPVDVSVDGAGRIFVADRRLRQVIRIE